MRQVKPEVILIARPQVDYEAMRQYLDGVGGSSWLDRLDESNTYAENLVEFGGRLCYRSWEPGLNANVTRIREDSRDYLGNILKSGHGSVLQHANFSFMLDNVSRILTHELVRHAAGTAYSQESMRFVRLTDLPFWFPDWALADEIFMTEAIRFLEHSEWFQRWMTEYFELDTPGKDFAEKKHKTSFMRRFAPGGHATGILATMNIRAIRHIIYMRTAISAEEEIRIVADAIARVCLTEFPNLMQDYSPNEDLEWIPEWIKV